VPEELLRETLTNFVGKIKQIPPLRAAVVRKPRERTIYFFDLLEMEGRDVLFHLGCEAGTYVRKLCHDVGKALGVGAHMKELRRIKVGEFSEEQAHSLLEIKDAYELWKRGNEKLLRKILISVEDAVFHVKKIFVKDSAIWPITNGAPVFVGGITRIQKGIQKGELIAIFSLKNELIALGIAKMRSKEMFERKRGVAVRTDRVIMKKGTYPDFRKLN
jgi:H/ACA ribonucleoprotein complex subunit 4